MWICWVDLKKEFLVYITIEMGNKQKKKNAVKNYFFSELLFTEEM